MIYSRSSIRSKILRTALRPFFPPNPGLNPLLRGDHSPIPTLVSVRRFLGHGLSNFLASPCISVLRVLRLFSSYESRVLPKVFTVNSTVKNHPGGFLKYIFILIFFFF
jgi:hypothetical protein